MKQGPGKASAGAILLAVLLACSLASPLAAGNATGTIQRLDMPGGALGRGNRDVRVYLPPSYSRPESASRRYPVIYLLHGWPGSEGNWFGSGHAGDTVDSLIARGRIPELILICPDGGRGLLGRSLYLNSADGFRMEDFIVRDVVAWTDSVFRTRPEPAARALVGLSDGGSGAANLTFRHPGVFGACASLSGEFQLEKDFGSGGALGPEPGASRIIAENSPARYAERMVPTLKRLTIYFDCGSSDGFLPDNRRFDALLTRLGVPHTYREYVGTHHWSSWRLRLVDALQAVTAGMWTGSRPSAGVQP